MAAEPITQKELRGLLLRVRETIKVFGQSEYSQDDLQRIKDLRDELETKDVFASEAAHLSVFEMVKKRFIPLFATMIIELFVAAVLSHYEFILAKYALLSSFLPLVSAVSGNHGLQSGALTIRALATSTEGHWTKVLSKEIKVALLCGLGVGTCAGAIAYLWQSSFPMAAVVFFAMNAAMLTAASFGVMVPRVFSYLGLDPALFAGPFETTAQDVVGYSVYLTTLYWILGA